MTCIKNCIQLSGYDAHRNIQPARCLARAYDRRIVNHWSVPPMSLNSLLCSLLAAYACGASGASGSYETPRRDV
ncbi:hypothetical protein GIW70_18055 [Pseudomonas syringae]|nr:hypothetical protein [Pseudomonas syringae]MCF5070094.1 hypothetical protein [Pseudomonas syringae]